MSEEKKRNVNAITITDLENAIDTINKFTGLYVKANYALKKQERAKGMFERSMGGSKDPFTNLVMGSMEQIMEKKATEIAEKRMEKVKLPAGGERLSDEDMEEAMEGLSSDEKEEEEKE
jgi:hypothetical protein